MTHRARRAASRAAVLACTAALLLAAGALAGCGGSGRTTDGTSMTPLEPAPPPAGAPVRVMIWAPQAAGGMIAYPDLPMVAQAYADLINTEGGVNGRPLVVLSCDEGDTADGAERCAREAVQERVLAVVGSTSGHAEAYLPVLEAAGMPYLGGQPLGPRDLTSPVSFPITGGPALLVTGAARLAAMQGCRRVALVREDWTPIPMLERSTLAGLRGGGATLTSETDLPTGLGPLGPQVAEATRDSDCVLLATGDQGTQRFLASYQQQGATQQVYTIGGGQTAGVAAQFPEVSSRTFLTEALPPDGNGAWRRYHDALARSPRSAEIDQAGAVQRQTWTALEAFLQVARQLTRFDTAAMLAALRGSAAVDTGGLVPALDFTRDRPLPGLGRLFNPTVTYQRFEDGRFTELRPGFQDLTPVLAAAGR